MAGLILGGIGFTGFEIPDKINFGGKHNAPVHKLIGGERVIDAMGGEPDQITWSGRFRGEGSVTRALAIDEMRIAGAQVDLAWLNLYRTVVIVAFSAATEKSNEVPYQITCEVVTDRASLLTGLFRSIDALVGLDLRGALSVLSQSNFVLGAVSNLSSTLAAIGPLLASPNATRAKALAAADSAATALQGQAAIDSSVLGQAMPAGLPANIAAWLSQQTSTAVANSATVDVTAYVQRLSSNIATVKQ